MYDDFFTSSFIQEVIAEHQLKLLIFEPNREEVVLWID
ncbi:element excision factor XisH family protein [[Phormidium ambiguum] IAM M-71]|nr:element excision factor XisH family protein [Phormidium ambiguum]